VLLQQAKTSQGNKKQTLPSSCAKERNQMLTHNSVCSCSLIFSSDQQADVDTKIGCSDKVVQRTQAIRKKDSPICMKDSLSRQLSCTCDIGDTTILQFIPVLVLVAALAESAP